MENENNVVFTKIEIQATPEQVWNVLTDWNMLKEWSSSFIGISVSKPVKGEKFVSYFKNPLSSGNIALEHICTEYEEGVKFGWSGDIIGKIKDHHVYSLEPTPSGTTLFKQEDGLHGPHSKFFNFLAEHKMTAMYKRFNKELKIRVESIYLKY
ncbi:Polyketide cyclase / dehydrase and lipid transport [Cyclobacterium xiamenense]|uniref:Polyketide cyclase / dehydrase and lipid transport n=1 Tax=Cyclobacterium xiamenense TaxID=1297121 RepID=A0A1H6TEE7_9BACT|nr:SRPBCC domain-containing protein [Cyclobacterium xiamenense]SEI75457.1 Polyketide cyclase / dehydrase and lipid transport [Cyclobacterium xiamenense]